MGRQGGHIHINHRGRQADGKVIVKPFALGQEFRNHALFPSGQPKTDCRAIKGNGVDSPQMGHGLNIPAIMPAEIDLPFILQMPVKDLCKIHNPSVRSLKCL